MQFFLINPLSDQVNTECRHHNVIHSLDEIETIIGMFHLRIFMHFCNFNLHKMTRNGFPWTNYCNYIDSKAKYHHLKKLTFAAGVYQSLYTGDTDSHVGIFDPAL
jgi:hypothetical protein